MDDELGTWLGHGNYVGELRAGPDGQLYQWVEGMDGLGNPIGFWKAIKSVGKAIGGVAKTIGKGIGAVTKLPGVRQLLPMAAGAIPGIGPIASAGIKAAQSAGLLGEGDYVGEVREGPDGSLYQWEEGVDGLGNPFGFWKAISAVRRFAQTPLGRQAVGLLPPGVRQAAQSAGFLGHGYY